ncbi:GTP 3',8-cyclase MoaA [Microscilla marina]|uniref:GTP 3',8-cyclase n=1 Tax=Microscilla marina ATCC 23134 TaxID=313606 RepID=A1ZKS6_MICM2|nr:GTP 3',8-cyclase MoaA [Microscilla marina]EAY28892.1 molybdenum cofactor biosynthesis protein A [Microscilla marina ATCC 23134]
MQLPSQIIDNHGRPINYLRLAVTDRCNLRCFYCMPEEGIKYLPKKHLLSYEEMERLVRLLASMGVNKIRLTGGEPFLRKDLINFMQTIRNIEGINELNITTNGVLTEQYIPAMVKMGISSVNLSLDTLDKERFLKITRRNEFDKVMRCLDALIESGIKTKINMVVMAGQNTEDIVPLAELTRTHAIGVRYIEEMPFNGEGQRTKQLAWNHQQILATLKAAYPTIERVKTAPHATSVNYQVPEHQGSLGIIAAFSRTFCGSCNRIRMTAQGTLKTCLYDQGVLDVKQLMRAGATDQALAVALLGAFNQRAKDGYEAEQKRKNQLPVSESMSTIGG